VRGRKGEYRKDLLDLQKKGFQRVKIDGAFHDIDAVPGLDKKVKHDIDVVVDRIVVGPDIAARLADSLETALRLADGIAVAEFADRPLGSPPPVGRGPGVGGGDISEPAVLKSKNDTHERLIFSEKFACPVSGFTIEEIEPRLFSFNSPHGACPKCDGLGTELRFEADLVVPDKLLSLFKGAVAPWARTGASVPYYFQTLDAICQHYGASMHDPWYELPERVRDVILYGSDGEEITFTYDDGMRSYKTRKSFEGVLPNIERRWRESDSAWVREELRATSPTTRAPPAAATG
jgi:excinuclease ABC subunit A